VDRKATRVFETAVEESDEAEGVTGDYTLIRGALHAIALRESGDTLLPLPRAGTWGRLVAAELEGFQASFG
jgi:hypothetical protein